MTFRDKVFSIVKKIPRGKVLTYSEVARRAGNPRAQRAVGNIIGTNRSPQIPCHRVIRSDGTLGGYSMGGTKVKAQKLRAEGYKPRT
ncbi:MAG: MGMT family protein [Patescibacteria group bacterium]